jgi:putative ABC transport system permease protein
VTSYYDRFTQAVSAIPGVKAVVVADAPPLGGARMSFTSNEAGGRKIPAIDVSRVSEGYFNAMGFRFVSGRPLQKSDESGEPTVVLNETAARIFGDPATLSGSRIPLRGANRPPMYVAGVVRDVLQRGVEEAVKPMEYEPLPAASFDTYSHVIVRTTVQPDAIVSAMRNVARRLDPAMPLPEIATLDERLAKDAAPRKFTFLLVGAFAAIGAILAVIGLYGVMSYVVAERTNEIGVRVALGADARRVMRLVVGEGMTMTTVGVLVGLAGSAVAVRLLRTMLFRVSIYDPSIFTAAAIVLVLTALAACLIPARRAARLDPLEALRAG